MLEERGLLAEKPVGLSVEKFLQRMQSGHRQKSGEGAPGKLGNSRPKRGVFGRPSCPSLGRVCGWSADVYDSTFKSLGSFSLVASPGGTLEPTAISICCCLFFKHLESVIVAISSIYDISEKPV